MAMLRRVAFLLLVSLTGFAGLAGCGHNVEFDDTYSGLLESRVAKPYALGLETTITARWSDRGLTSDWFAVSEDPAVIEILAQRSASSGSGGIDIDIRAAGEGLTRLVVTDRGRDEVGSVSLQVTRATGLMLLDRALQRAQRITQEVTDEIRVAAGQTMAMEARYLAPSGERAYGRDLLSWPEIAGLTVWTDAETLGRDKEYILLSADGPGDYSLPLAVHGLKLRTLRIVAVPKTDITAIDLLHPPEDDAEAGDTLCAGILAYDGAGNRVFGPPATWRLHGELLGGGDLLCYDYAPDVEPMPVQVTVGTVQAQIYIRGEEFYTASTSTIGCSAAGPVTSGASLGLLLLGGALLLRRLLR